MKKIILAALAVILILGLAACAQPASGNVLQSDKPRNTTPGADKTDLGALVSGNNEFAFDLYRTLRTTDGNLFYSPYSLSLALAMTYAGARGNTEKEMAEVLNFSLPQERLHNIFNYLDLQLASRGQNAKGKDGEGFRLHIVNDIWGQKDYKFLPAFLDLLAQNYGAGLRVVDFIKQTEPSRLTINDYISQQTEQRIKDLLPQGSINEMTRLVLTNAIYFNAAWANQFEKSNTTTGDFLLLDGKKVSVPMMRQTKSLGYAAGDGYKAVELPYSGRELSMVLVVPDEGRFSAFESSLTGERLGSLIQSIKSQQVALSMPKFQFDSSFGLKKALSGLGMATAFTDAADFSGMNGRRDLLIQDVLHKSFVAVDEAGTEAAAASAVIMGVTSMPAEPVQLRIDRPFIFVIRDIPTGTVLFVGRVINPA